MANSSFSVLPEDLPARLHGEDTSWGLRIGWVLLTFLIPLAIFSATSAAHNHKSSKRDFGRVTVPDVPSPFPLISHLIKLSRSPYQFITSTLRNCGWKTPMQVKTGFVNFTIIANPQHVQAIFKASKQLTSQPSAIFALRHLFGTPEQVISFYEADDSGMAATPRKGSHTKQQDRIHFHQAHTAQQFLAGGHVLQLSLRYLETLKRNIDSLGLAEDEWTEFPDLYQFLQTHVSRSAIESIMGTKILELNPTLVQNFWIFDYDVPMFLRCIPRLLMPRAYRARDELLSSIKRWHAHAHENSDCSRLGPEDPEWEPYLGSKLIRARQHAYRQMDRMNAESRASEDLGLMFAINANVLPSIFWFIFESLRDPSLGQAMMSEVAAASSPPPGGAGSGDGGGGAGVVDIGRLASQPMLQSCYAEVLRLRVAIAMSRVSELEDFRLAGFTIPRNHPLMIFSRPLALNDEAWALAGRPQTVPLDQFHAGRFLVADDSSSSSSSGPKNNKNNNNNDDGAPGESPTTTTTTTTTTTKDSSSEARRYSLDGLAGLWVPYGGGQRMCPGRHFAKNEILGTFAVLRAHYDIELVGEDEVHRGVEPDLRWFPVGALPPKAKVPFRIRKRRAHGTDGVTRS